MLASARDASPLIHLDCQNATARMSASKIRAVQNARNNICRFGDKQHGHAVPIGKILFISIIVKS